MNLREDLLSELRNQYMAQFNDGFEVPAGILETQNECEMMLINQ